MLYFNRLFLSLVLVLLVFFSSPLVIRGQQKLSSTQLQEDFQVVSDVIVNLSPLLDSSQRKGVSANLNNRKGLLNGKSFTTDQFMIFLVNSASCGDKYEIFDEHASFQLDQSYAEELLKVQEVFPYPIYIIGDALYINIDSVSIPFGSKIISINGKSTANIMDNIQSVYAKWDANFVNDHFDYLFYLIFGNYKEFAVKFLNQQGEEHTVSVKSVNGIDKAAFYAKRVYPINIRNTAYYYQIDTLRKIAYIQLNTFNLGLDDLGAFMNEAFTSMIKSKVKSIIVDIRNNQGGILQLPSIFLQGFAHVPFEEEIIVTAPNVQLPYPNYIEGFSDSSFKIGNRDSVNIQYEAWRKSFGFKQSANANESVMELTPYTKTNPNEQAFTGQVYLLTGPSTFSAATYFTALFKQYQVGTIVGDKLMGNLKQMSAGPSVSYSLPNSKIQLTVPLFNINFHEGLLKVFPTGEVKPDITLPNDLKVKYFLERKDPELDYVLDVLIKE